MTAIKRELSTICHMEMAADPVSDTERPSPGRRERRVAATRRSILANARTLFETRGYAETTVEQIADAADVAPRTFFRYFPTKESLLFAAFDEARRAMLDVLRARPTDEDPLRSVMHALRWMAGIMEAHRDDIVWGFRLAADQHVDGVYERSMIKEDTNAQLAGFIAARLGVDVDTDPRPLTWAMAIMAVFTSALKFSSAEDAVERPGGAAELFDELLEGTALILSTCAGIESALD